MRRRCYLTIGLPIVLFIIVMAIGAEGILPVMSAGGQDDKNNGRPTVLENENTLKPGAIVSPEYPAKTSYYAFGSRKAETTLDKSFMNNLVKFTSGSTSAALSAAQSEGNQIFSPLSLYMAMTANGAGEETQSEMIKAMFMSNLDMEALNSQIYCLFQNLYFDNEVGSLKLANSLCLDHKITLSLMHKKHIL